MSQVSSLTAGKMYYIGGDQHMMLWVEVEYDMDGGWN